MGREAEDDNIFLSQDDVVKQVSCGGSHTLILTESGKLYSNGRGDYGRLGHGDEETKDIPQLINIEHRKEWEISTISAGGAHSAAILQMKKEDGKRLINAEESNGKIISDKNEVLVRFDSDDFQLGEKDVMRMLSNKNDSPESVKSLQSEAQRRRNSATL